MKNKYIRRIVVATLIMTFITTIITLVATVLTDNIDLIFLVPLLFIGLLLYFIFYVFVPYRRGISRENAAFSPELSSSDVNIGSLKQISTTTLFSTIAVPDNTYFFDDSFFYEKKDGGFTKINLTDIIEIGKTKLEINHRKVWFVKCNHNGVERVFRFQHNYTLWNRNFIDFQDHVRTINPNAKILKFGILGM